jgi:hypothetical protein
MCPHIPEVEPLIAALYIDFREQIENLVRLLLYIPLRTVEEKTKPQYIF